MPAKTFESLEDILQILKTLNAYLSLFISITLTSMTLVLGVVNSMPESSTKIYKSEPLRL